MSNLHVHLFKLISISFSEIMAIKSAGKVAIAIKGTPFLGFASFQANPTTPFLIPFSTFHSENQFPFSAFHSENQSTLTVYDQMQRKPSVIDSGTLLKFIVKKRQYSIGVLLFKKMRLPINEYTRSTIINCYCRLKRVDLGFAIIATFLKRGYAPDTVSMNCLINGLFFEGKAVEAVELFRKVIREKLCEVDEFTTSIVLDGLCKWGNVVDAIKMLVNLESVNGKLSTDGYTAVIDGLCKSRMVDDALSLLSRMIERGFLPDVVTYTALIKGLCDFRRLDEANKLLKHMMDDKVYPNVQTFNTLLDCYCKERLLKNAENVVEIMKQWDVKPDVITYNTLMNGYCLQGQFDKAIEVLNLMIKEGLKPNVISYNTIINGYCREGLFQEAEGMLERMEQSGCFPDSVFYRSITKCCLKHHVSVDSTNLLKRIAERVVALDRCTS